MVSDAETKVITGLTPGEKRHLRALESRIQRGLGTFREVGEALLDIRDNRLYRETHPNFEAYCRERWQLERGRAYQLIGAVEVLHALGGEGGEVIANEAQARELVPLMREDPALVAEVWHEVTSQDEPVTAPRIREVVRRHIRQADPGPQVSETTRLIDMAKRLGSAYEKWVATNPSKQERVHVRMAIQELLKVIT